MTNQDLVLYYKERAKEYDKVYSIPEEQEDLVKATAIFQNLFQQKSVIEIACGTGYWTEQIAKSATSVLATDINETVIDIARSRKIFKNVTFEVADMFAFTPKADYDALFGGFIWSHILLQDLDNFLDKIRGFLKPNAIVAFIDSKQKEGGSHSIKRITHTDNYGNTYQTRSLENGTTRLVLKNFPTQEFLMQKLTKFSRHITYIDLENYWIIYYTLDYKKQ